MYLCFSVKAVFRATLKIIIIAVIGVRILTIFAKTAVLKRWLFAIAVQIQQQ
jgi:hypothetical protein